MALRDLYTYARQAAKLAWHDPPRFPLVQVARSYGRWYRSLQPPASSIADEQPWMTFAAIDFLERVASGDMSVFEFGGGGSTLFFAKRVREVVTVEHDPAWARRLEAVLTERGYGNCRLLETAPTSAGPGRPSADPADPADPAAYASSDANFRGMSFEGYVKQIDVFPDHSFDIISIDGRARPSCFIHALAKVKPGGYIVMDNSDRPEYHRAMAAAPASFHRRDLRGPCPYVGIFTTTTVWRAP